MTNLGQVAKGVSWEELIQACIQCFDAEGNVCHSCHLLNITLTMHRLLMSSEELLDKLVLLYPSYWISEFWTMFRLHSCLAESLEQFRELVRESGQENLCLLLQTKWMGDREWSRKASQKIKTSTKKRKVSLLFDHLEPVELAEHLTYLEFKSFCKISFADYQKYIRNQSLTEIPTMERSIALCNGVSQWVQLMVLNRPTAQLRAEVFAKFIYVAQNLQQMQNFNTLMAVVGGLCHSSISRLKDTCTYVPNESTKVLNEMTDLLSSSRNYENYRQTYGRCSGFKIPILGVHLKDLIAVNEAMSDYVENSKINVPKLQALYNHINELVQLQQNPPLLDANKDLVHLLTLSLDLYYTEDEIYELSYTREPRNHRAAPATPYRPPVVVDWASGVALKPDPKTISKHVQRMVDSVFTNYDHDGRGFISQEDFEKIASSFPFSFCVMDKDKDGLISKEEITAYFMRASVICSKLGLGFSHNFQEMTYMRPTFCDNCSGFLWGVIKQGYRCSDCGMNCHKSCKDQVAFECKKHARVNNADWSPSSHTTDTEVTGGHDDGTQFIYCSSAQMNNPDQHKHFVPSSASCNSLPSIASSNTMVHKSTQTETGPSPSQLQASLLSPSPTMLTPCPSPVPQRKQRACSTKTSVTLHPKEENLNSCETLEKENRVLLKSNEVLQRKLKEAEREVEILKTLLRRRTHRPMEEDSSSSS